MPPLETDMMVETQDTERVNYHMVQELKHLCSMIKKVMSERLDWIRGLGELTEMCKEDWPHTKKNWITEVNTKQEKFSQNAEKGRN